ncbi:hypothetical protein [Methylobacterium sp. ID0610]|uniref:hypothetical protein n=1 Tax=Methylobacterium carpenticola TaxID=3344827 RepID=UPI00369FA1E1
MTSLIFLNLAVFCLATSSIYMLKVLRALHERVNMLEARHLYEGPMDGDRLEAVRKHVGGLR